MKIIKIKHEGEKGFARAPTLALLLCVFNKIKQTYLNMKRKDCLRFTERRNKNTTPKLVSGFALLFAVITASVLLTIGLSIFNISLKELLLSTASRDSQVAFYAADSARECALYWDIRQSAFPTCIGDDCDSDNYFSGNSPIICGTKEIILNRGGFIEGETVYTTTGTFLYSEPQDISSTTPDALFSVEKTYISGEINTEIKTFGHNAEIGERRVERGIKQTY